MGRGSPVSCVLFILLTTTYDGSCSGFKYGRYFPGNLHFSQLFLSKLLKIKTSKPTLTTKHLVNRDPLFCKYSNDGPCLGCSFSQVSWTGDHGVQLCWLESEFLAHKPGFTLHPRRWTPHQHRPLRPSAPPHPLQDRI